MLHAQAVILGWALYPNLSHIPLSQAALPDSGLGTHSMEAETEVQRGPTVSYGVPALEMEVQPLCPIPGRLTCGPSGPTPPADTGLLWHLD